MGTARNGLIHRQKVLVWASNPSERAVFRDQIARLGWEVKYPVVVADPEKYLQRSPIDVALLDTDLQVINLSAWEAACNKYRVPLVLIKAHDIRKRIDSNLKSVLEVYKPVDGQSIRITLTRAMQERNRKLVEQAADL